MKRPNKWDNQADVRHGSGDAVLTDEEKKKQEEIKDAITKGGRDIPKKSSSGD